MEQERFYPSGGCDPDNPGPRRQRLEDLRRRAEQYAAAARDALARAQAQGAPEEQLANLRNTSGQ